MENRQNLKEQKEQKNIDKFNLMVNYLTLDKKVDDPLLSKDYFNIIKKI